ncbi:hypothetical protein PoB_003911400 [Plakobranchus ocellatus]|uniref:Uncharacterized protein n=1 Tax=Plakobranchus ocellatus TaxID=259542 RepID=A0AAV4B1P0_9GAST|nr:hypothetical protein PoB_003911400 [Plakobranchus ocellatus]
MRCRGQRGTRDREIGGVCRTGRYAATVEYLAETSGDGVRTEWSRLSVTRIVIQRDGVLPLSDRRYLERLGSSGVSVEPGWLSGRQCRVNARYSGRYLECARLWKAAQQFESVWLWRAARVFIPGLGWPPIVRETVCAALGGRTCSVGLWRAVPHLAPSQIVIVMVIGLDRHLHHRHRSSLSWKFIVVVVAL